MRFLLARDTLRVSLATLWGIPPFPLLPSDLWRERSSESLQQRERSSESLASLAAEIPLRISGISGISGISSEKRVALSEEMSEMPEIRRGKAVERFGRGNTT